MKTRYEILTLKDIPKSPLFKNRYHSDTRDLQSSIQTKGVLHPPYLYQSKDGLKVVDGLFRIEYAIQNGLDELGCFVIDEADVALGDVFLFFLELNRWSRKFNDVEKALLIQQSHDVYRGSMIPKAFWTLIDVPQKIKLIQQYRDLLKFPDFILKYAVNNQIPLKVLLLFQNFSDKDAEKLAHQLFVYPLNQNKLSEILTLISDLSRREKMPGSEIFNDVLASLKKGMALPEKEKRIRDALKKRKNPNFEQQLEDFKSKAEALPLEGQASLQPAPYFEDDYVEMNVKLYNQDDIQNLIKALQHRAWHDILKT